MTSATTTRHQGKHRAEPARGGRHLGLALFVISIAQLMVVLDATIVNVALPKIQSSLGFTGTGLEWVVTAYTLTFGGLLLLGGRAGDILGRRRVFVAGVAIFSVASLVGGFAQTQWWLLGARGLQGIGGAIMAPTALSLITTTFPAGKPRNRAMAVYAAMSGAGAAIGLILGGVLTSYVSWRAVLFVNVPIGVICALAAPFALVESERHHGRFDLPGAFSATAGFMLLVYGLTHAAPTQKVVHGVAQIQRHWGDTATIVTLALSGVLLAYFFVNEWRSRHALMPIRVIAERNRGGAYLTSLAIGTAMFGIFFFLTIFVQLVWGYSPVRTGVAFLPVSAGIVIAAGISSQLVAKLGALKLLLPGTLLVAGGMYWLSFINEGSTYASGLLAPMLLTAIGLGLVFMPLTLVAVHGVENADAGVASSLLNTGQQIGGSIGLAVLGTVVYTAIANYGQVAYVKALQKVLHVPASALHQQAAGGAPKLPSGAQQRVAAQARDIALSHGIHYGFIVAAGVALLAFVVVAISIRVSRDELQGTDGPAHLG
jgi:EmrB/QacA subfamily drug resistance transporter